LCESADVVIIESELAGAVLGLAPADIRPWIGDRTTCLHISPFATDGPLAHYRATDLGIMARGGWMSVLGRPEREPLRPGGDLIYRVTGMVTFAAALAAIRHRDQGGRPQFVDVSEHVVAAAMQLAPWLSKSMVGVETRRR